MLLLFFDWSCTQNNQIDNEISLSLNLRTYYHFSLQHEINFVGLVLRENTEWSVVCFNSCIEAIPLHYYHYLAMCVYKSCQPYLINQTAGYSSSDFSHYNLLVFYCSHAVQVHMSILCVSHKTYKTAIVETRLLMKIP